ncbi:MAG: hypothetical protein HFF17_14790 [Oscillospiraceae bacterium]|nr:hypothetical protein [Oscillospiraceae bacterium]
MIIDVDGRVQRCPSVTPAEDLIAAVEIDYTAYRQEIQRLYEDYPLFEAKLDISVSELEDLAAEALMLHLCSSRSTHSFFLSWETCWIKF